MSMLSATEPHKYKETIVDKDVSLLSPGPFLLCFAGICGDPQILESSCASNVTNSSSNAIPKTESKDSTVATEDHDGNTPDDNENESSYCSNNTNTSDVESLETLQLHDQSNAAPDEFVDGGQSSDAEDGISGEFAVDEEILGWWV